MPGFVVEQRVGRLGERAEGAPGDGYASDLPPDKWRVGYRPVGLTAGKRWTLSWVPYPPVEFALLDRAS